jgi:hypothetical protein
MKSDPFSLHVAKITYLDVRCPNCCAEGDKGRGSGDGGRGTGDGGNGDIGIKGQGCSEQ